MKSCRKLMYSRMSRARNDGTRLWESAQWAHDGGASLVLVNHATSEEPWMISLAVYLRGVFPGVRGEHVPGGWLCGTIS